MSEILLKMLEYKNFKAFKEFRVDFERETNIYGENKLGKTTILDGWNWLLLDKDSKDRSKFEIQPLDENNKVIDMVETQVRGILVVDGKNIELRKVLKQKWVKKRGEIKAENKGTETQYYINEVPVKLSEYKEKINSIIDEKLFKLITNPLYFSLNLKTEERKKVLLDMVGDVSAESVVNYNPSLKPLLKILEDSDLDSFKKVISAKIKKLTEEKKSIPFRVDELNKSISNVDFAAIAFRKRGILASIDNLSDRLMDSSKINQELVDEKDRLYSLKAKLRDMEFKLTEEAQQPLTKLKAELKLTLEELYKNETASYAMNSAIENNRLKISYLERELQELRDKWGVVSDEKLNIAEEEFCCPTCKRDFEAHDIEAKRRELTENFKMNKDKKIQNINNLGKGKKELLGELQSDIRFSEIELDSLNTRLQQLRDVRDEKEEALNNFDLVVGLSQNEDFQKLKLEMEALEVKVQQPIDVTKNSLELKAEKEKLELELEEVNGVLGFKDQNVKTNARISELIAEEKRLADIISGLEGQEILCENFIKTKVELVESSINSKFKFVKFKLFNTLVNGAVEEYCEALIEGVPFGNTNTASQFNAGIDIINALSEHYKVSAPVFIDNRESVNEILGCNSQIVNLFVSKDKKLVIKSIESEGA